MKKVIWSVVGVALVVVAVISATSFTHVSKDGGDKVSSKSSSAKVVKKGWTKAYFDKMVVAETKNKTATTYDDIVAKVGKPSSQSDGKNDKGADTRMATWRKDTKSGIQLVTLTFIKNGDHYDLTYKNSANLK